MCSISQGQILAISKLIYHSNRADSNQQKSFTRIETTKKDSVSFFDLHSVKINQKS